MEETEPIKIVEHLVNMEELLGTPLKSGLNIGCYYFPRIVSLCK